MFFWTFFFLGMIERSMYLGHYDWGKVHLQPTEVRTYVKEILINITQVHAEVSYYFYIIFG